METRKFEIAILAAGDFPRHKIPLRRLHGADAVVCCDSAYLGYMSHSMDDGRCVVVGDGDSLPLAVREALGDRFVCIEEQDYNDLHKAVAYAVGRWGGVDLRISIFGATGKREDHTIGNISYLAYLSEQCPDVEFEMLTDYGRFVSFRGHRQFDSFARQQVSIFTASPDVEVSGVGLEYPLQRLKLRHWYNGTLNSALGNSFELMGEGWITVFQTYEAK